MNKLLNLKNEKEKSKKHQKKQRQIVRKFRREIIALAANTPEYLYKFCNKFQHNYKKLLIEFENKKENDKEIKDFLLRNEIIWKHNIVENEINYKDVILYIFGTDKEYERNAKKLVKNTGYFFLESLYFTINYIEDNFPVTRKMELKENEKRLIKFLLYHGTEIEYIEKYKISLKIFNNKVKNICDNYKCENINQVLNLVLIEKHFRNKNNNLIDVLKKINMEPRKYKGENSKCKLPFTLQ